MSTELFSTLPYKVADITLADFGRKEIDLAEKEMPGLMSAGALVIYIQRRIMLLLRLLLPVLRYLHGKARILPTTGGAHCRH